MSKSRYEPSAASIAFERDKQQRKQESSLADIRTTLCNISENTAEYFWQSGKVHDDNGQIVSNTVEQTPRYFVVYVAEEKPYLRPCRPEKAATLKLLLEQRWLQKEWFSKRIMFKLVLTAAGKAAAQLVLRERDRIRNLHAPSTER